MDFSYQDERFADLQLLRYRLNGFEQLTPQQKALVFYLSEATLWGRDITFDQFGKYNLRIRKMLEVVYCDATIYHHYGCEKFKPDFSSVWLRTQLHLVDVRSLPLEEGETVDAFCDAIFPVIFDPDVLPKRVNKADGSDLLLTSACHFYEGVTQTEAENFYAAQKQAQASSDTPPSFGLNSTLVKSADGSIREEVWSANGKYANALLHIIYWLEKALTVAENATEKSNLSVDKLLSYR